MSLANEEPFLVNIFKSHNCVLVNFKIQKKKIIHVYPCHYSIRWMSNSVQMDPKSIQLWVKSLSMFAKLVYYVNNQNEYNKINVAKQYCKCKY